MREFDGSVTILDDIRIEDQRFCHGDNGIQEFYETTNASHGICLGLLRNHGEEVWIAYATRSQAIRTLTGCTRRSDGRLDAEPLYGTKNEPQSLAEGLIRLWQAYGVGIVSLPCHVVAAEEEKCASTR